MFFRNLMFQNLLIAVIFIAQLLFIAILRPYVEPKSNYRPIANTVIMIIIECIFAYVRMTDDSQSIVAIYGPILIILLIITCIAYTGYEIVRMIK